MTSNKVLKNGRTAHPTAHTKMSKGPVNFRNIMIHFNILKILSFWPLSTIFYHLPWQSTDGNKATDKPHFQMLGTVAPAGTISWDCQHISFILKYTNCSPMHRQLKGHNEWRRISVNTAIRWRWKEHKKEENHMLQSSWWKYILLFNHRPTSFISKQLVQENHLLLFGQVHFIRDVPHRLCSRFIIGWL